MSPLEVKTRDYVYTNAQTTHDIFCLKFAEFSKHLKVQIE